MLSAQTSYSACFLGVHVYVFKNLGAQWTVDILTRHKEMLITTHIYNTKNTK